MPQWSRSQLAVVGCFASEASLSCAGRHTADNAGNDGKENAEEEPSQSKAYDSTDREVEADIWLTTYGWEEQKGDRWKELLVY